MSGQAKVAQEQSHGDKVFSKSDLKSFDGKNGAPEYIAINGIVYDITGVHLFREGKHHGVTAGNDVSTLFVHKPNILNRLRVVGRFV